VAATGADNGGVVHVRHALDGDGRTAADARQRLADPLYALIVFWAGMCFGIAAALLVIRFALGGPLL
jgi:hypothetical protein